MENFQRILNEYNNRRMQAMDVEDASLRTQAFIDLHNWVIQAILENLINEAENK